MRNISYFGKCKWQRIALPLSAAVLSLFSVPVVRRDGFVWSDCEGASDQVTVRRGEARSVKARSGGCLVHLRTSVEARRGPLAAAACRF